MSTAENKKSPVSDSDIFLTEEQLADRWQVSDKKLQADRWRGVGVPYVKFARVVRYRLSDIRAYEDKQSRGGRVG